MSASTIRVSVDPRNPGQFFACYGLLDMAHRLCDGAAGWFEDGGFLVEVRRPGTLAEIVGQTAEHGHLLRWETTVADRRVHGTTRRQVGEHFESVERRALLPLPAGRFPSFHEARRRVHRDGHVEVAKAYYSVPPEHVGRDVWARWDGRVVRILDMRLRQVAVHAQRDPGRFSTQDRHVSSRKVPAVERGAAWLISRAGLIGSHAEKWAAQVVAHRGVEGIRTVAGLRSLAERHRAAAIDRACRIALGHGAHRLRDLRWLMERSAADEQASMEFVAEDPLTKPLAEYERLAGPAFRRGPAHAARGAPRRVQSNRGDFLDLMCPFRQPRLPCGASGRDTCRMLMTRDRWASLVASFDSSGLTVAEYCDRRGVSRASFHRWRRLLREAPAHRAPCSFVEAVVRPAGTAPAVEVSR